MIINVQSNNLHYQRGLAAIELTIILPFLLFMIFSIFEFGRLLYQYNALNHLVRDATRYAIVDVIDGDTGIVTSNTIALVEPTVRNILIYGDSISTEELLPNLSTAAITITATNSNFVTLRVSYNWQPFFVSGLPSFFSADRVDLSFPLIVNYTMRAL